MESIQTLQNEIIQFLRTRDYKLLEELGQGACGKTVLLHDDLIDEHFVCKKYVPYSDSQREILFENFVREVKLLLRLHHENVVRVFNYYLYPEKFAGYILMEFIDGLNIDEHLQKSPEQINDLFLQAVEGFAHLEKCGILHRDIRPGNLLVTKSGRLKIIDLGFGKRIVTSTDFEKSISLNWWCPTPKEFNDGRYDFATEVYFVGKLFEQLILDNVISDFKYSEVLNEMCKHEPLFRTGSFEIVNKRIRSDQFDEIGFSDSEQISYRNFANAIYSQITKIESSANYVSDISKIVTRLSDTYRSVMLETIVPDPSVVIRCILTGTYYSNRRNSIITQYLRDFVKLLKSSSTERQRIIIANLHTRLDSVPRYYNDITDDDIPF